MVFRVLEVDIGRVDDLNTLADVSNEQLTRLPVSPSPPPARAPTCPIREQRGSFPRDLGAEIN